MKANLQSQGIRILEKLAQGGQGEIFHVIKHGQNRVLKLYDELNSTPQQRDILLKLIAKGVPDAQFANRFAWPEEFVEITDENRFGYLMPLINTEDYISITAVEGKQVPHPGFGICVEVARQFAQTFRMVHIHGWCLRDISKNNLKFSPQTGDVVLLDNDSIVTDGYTGDDMEGTPGYPAPEVILKKAHPSTLTDLHSLAVLLFQLLCWHHPFQGVQESKIMILNKQALDELYGLNPVFIFDPIDRSNRLPDEAGYQHAKAMWMVLPDYIKKLFVRAFTVGIHTPSLRVMDNEWENALTLLQGQRHICSCGAENFFDPSRRKQRPCWHQGCQVSFPPKLVIHGERSGVLLIKKGQQLTSHRYYKQPESSLQAPYRHSPPAMSSHAFGKSLFAVSLLLEQVLAACHWPKAAHEDVG